MEQYAADIFNELPEFVQQSVSVLAIAPTLNQQIAERLLKSSGITNGNTREVLTQLLSFPVWVDRNDSSWCITEDIRDVAIKKLNGNTLSVKKRVVEVLKDIERKFDSKSYTESQDFQLQLARLSLSIPEEQEQAIQKLRSFFEAAEAFNNHEGARIVSLYMDESHLFPGDRNEYPPYLLSAYFVRGLHAYRNNMPDIALKYLLPVYQYHDDSGIRDAAFASHFIGIIYSDRRKFGEAEKTYNDSLGLRVRIDDQFGRAQVYHSLGNLYRDWNRLEKAEQAYKNSLEIAADPNTRINSAQRKDLHIAQVYHNLGNIHTKLGKIHTKPEFYDDAASEYKKSLELNEKYHDNHGLALVYMNFGKLRILQKKYEDARSLLNKSLKYEKKPYFIEEIETLLKNLPK